ncbi:MAG: isoaspartyl peptidase/L-asparaginase family protein [Nitrospinota bacterium]
MKAAIAFQGGAIHPSDGEYGEAALRHLQVGVDILKKGGPALDAVVEVIVSAEDDPIFHAGTGARLNLKGQIEFDASLMDGETFGAGAVGGVQRIKNPIRLAKAFMEETDHVLLVGTEAEEIARKLGFEEHNPELPHRRQEWEELRARLRRGEELEGIYAYLKKIRRWADTVGACAVDNKGNFAAGTSSGGFPLKMPGRVGDVGVIGAATYAENAAGSITITGAGEVVIKTCLGFSVVQSMKAGKSAQATAEEHVKDLNQRFDNPLMFLVCIDKYGTVGAARNVDLTPHAFWQDGMDAPKGNFAPVFE